MVPFDLATLARSEGGEYVLGMKDLHTRTCYMIYGILEPGERDRLVRPGEGHEEILCAVDGPLTIHSEKGNIELQKGHAVHVKENVSFHISNPSERAVVYIMAGAPTGRSHVA
jgi:uncharacterized cupin superfamily protein